MNRTAIAGRDYTAVTVDLRFKPGEMQKTVNVPILKDSVHEGAELFSLVLSGAVGAVIVDGSGTGTILVN